MSQISNFTDCTANSHLTGSEKASNCADIPRSSNGKTTDSDSETARPNSADLRNLNSVCSTPETADKNGDCELSSPNSRKGPRSNECWETGVFTSDILYFIKAGDFVKIGRTKNMAKRLQWIKGACPLEIRLVASIENEGWSEAAWHKAFRATRVRGEWFHATEELRLAIEYAVAGDDWVCILSDTELQTKDERHASVRFAQSSLRDKFKKPEWLK